MENHPFSTQNLNFIRRHKFSQVEFLEISKRLAHIEKHGCEKELHARATQEIVDCFVASRQRTDVENAVGLVAWLSFLQHQQSLALLNESQFQLIIDWILKQLNAATAENNELIAWSYVAIGSLCASHSNYSSKFFAKMFCGSNSGSSLLKYLDKCYSTRILSSVVHCVDVVLYSLKSSEADLTAEESEICSEIGKRLLDFFYNVKHKPETDVENMTMLIYHCLQVVLKIISFQYDFTKLYISELMGLAKVYLRFGIDTEFVLKTPQKIYMSQQALYDSAEEMESKINSEKSRICGGKTQKTRKPRTLTKNILPADQGKKGMAVNSNTDNKAESNFVFEMKTSDSDFSDSENVNNRTLFERNRRAKIRLTAIAIVGDIARLMERKIIYGYWHALFPSGTAESHDDLLYVARHDPNMRCRSAALQVCAQLLFGSKGFLHQAEIKNKRCPATFIPFSMSLGLTVLAIYDSLTNILTTEKSLAVISQALKTLSVLVQATPFHQMEKGFVQKFIGEYIKPFVFHRDVAVQVSALMVMEFLVAVPEMNADIAEAVGLVCPQGKDSAVLVMPNGKAVGAEHSETVEIDEYIESEESEGDADDDDNNKISKQINAINSVKERSTNSWLILHVLSNLSRKDKSVVNSIRIESIQVLIAISSHFALLKPHLIQIAEVLEYTLDDSLADVRLYAARCIDSCAFQISRYLQESAGQPNGGDADNCHQFWTQMLPSIMHHIRPANNCEELASVKICLCDALSNIGALTFERLSRFSQINLLSFLSGVSSDETTEDVVVRASASRALAVFVLYPTLRFDLVFVENTAELTLRLASSKNLLVRIKAFWSLGNITDALIGKPNTETANSTPERISDDLLFRLLNAAIDACSDIDKVRCNAVRSLGNLLCLLSLEHFATQRWQQIFQKSINKLSHCIRSSGTAKVKWNACYAIGNVMRNTIIFSITEPNWRDTLYPAICNVIINHSNFKVRINATAALLNIEKRAYFGSHFEKFWSSMLEAMQQSNNLENFHEYNHRDNLQEQLCLAMAHLLNCALLDDLMMCKKHLTNHLDTMRNTWRRVVNRMVPEKAAPLLACPMSLKKRFGAPAASLSSEQKNALEFLVSILQID